jgi:DNA replication protein DnaC
MGNRHSELHSMLQSLKLTAMASACSEVALKAAKEGLSHEAFLYELVRLECEQRTQRRLERRLHQSGLPREKTFRTLQLDRFALPLRLQVERLRSGSFVQEARNVIAVGPPGVGKIHPTNYPKGHDGAI